MIFTLRQEASNKKTFLNIDARDSIGKSYEIEIEVYFYSRNSLTSLLQIKLGEEDWIMERKEILKRAQDEKLDERELQVKDKSMMWSYIVMVIMASVFSFIRSEQGLPMMDLCAIVSGSVCAAMTYRFIKTRNKEHLIISVIMFATAIMAIVRFCMGH